MDSPFTRLDLVGLPTAGVPICVCLRDIGRVIIATITMERVYISYVGKDADVTKVIVAIQSSFRSEMCFRHLSIDALWAGKRVYRSTWLHIVCVCKVRQGPRHKHHCGNEHDEHSFREFHTSKNLSVRNRRTSSKGRANQTCFAPKGLEICPFSRKNKLISATSLFRLTDVFSSGFPKSEFPKPDSPKSRGPRESAAECTAFPLGISPSITERGVLSRKVCQICRTSTLPTAVPSYNMPESYRLSSVYPLRCGSQKCFWVQYTITISLCQSYIAEILVFCILHNLLLAFLYKTT